MGEGASFGTELRRLRTAAGLSLSDLASRIHYSKGYLSRIETAAARPNRKLAELCDSELDTGGTLCSLVPAGRKPRPGTRLADVRLHVLPAATAHFVGRTGEMDEVCVVLSGEAQSGEAVCAIDGMAGVGKSALAIRAAHRLESGFADGCLFLDLRGYTQDSPVVSAAEALDRLLRLLGMPAEHIPSDVDDRAALYRDRVRGRRMLIVLDNARSTDQVMPLLPGDGRCRVLITSRGRLSALDDAHHISLGTLPAADAADLFRSMAGARRPPVDADNDSVVGRIVDGCGRLPLAIRIAAARYRGNTAWTLGELGERMANETARLSELDDGERSVAAALQLSYQHLPADQKRLFCLLSIHPGTDFDAAAAAAIANVELRSVERLLDRLLDANLLMQHADGRYYFHDLVRTFATESALHHEPMVERTAAVHRLLDYNLHAAERADELLTPHRYRPPLTFEHLPPVAFELRGRTDAMSWMTMEWPGLVALCRLAAERGLHDRCWQLAYTLRGYFFISKLWDAWIETTELAVAAARSAANQHALAMSLNNLGLGHMERGEIDVAASYYQEALVLFRAVGDEHGLSNTLAHQARVWRRRGNHQAALRDLRLALDFYRRVGAQRNSAITLRGIARVEAELGAFWDAVGHLNEALSVFIELGLALDSAMTLNSLGTAHYRFGQYEAAIEYYRRALSLSSGCGSPYEQARAEAGIGDIAATIGHRPAARRHWARALELCGELDAPQAALLRDRLANDGDAVAISESGYSW